ncbi:MAG: hypothetical protein H8E59_10210, partial [Actinobacteria bacterium]|nr:hypothetical protein [Actinomycetota bacterium]
MKSGAVRLFVAVWPSDELVSALAALPRPEAAGLRWTRPDQWHVTLRFLGEADPDEAAVALGALAAAPAVGEAGPANRPPGKRVGMGAGGGVGRLAGAGGGGGGGGGGAPRGRGGHRGPPPGGGAGAGA